MQVIGATTAIKKGEKISYKDNQGEIRYLQYQGSKEQIETLYEEIKTLSKAGTSNIPDIQVDTQTRPCTLTYLLADDIDFSTINFGMDARGYIYEISTERQSSPIENNPYFKDLSPNMIPRIKKALEDGTIDNTDWAAINGNDAIYTNYVNLLKKNLTTYYEFLWNVRKTVLYAKSSDITVSNSNVGKIVEESAIGLSSKISSILPSGMKYLKCPPSISTQKSIITVSQDYLGGLNWPEYLYD